MIFKWNFCNVIITTLKHFLCIWSIDNFVFDMSAVFFRTWYLWEKSCMYVLETNFLAILIWHLSLSAFSSGFISISNVLRILVLNSLLRVILWRLERNYLFYPLIWQPLKKCISIFMFTSSLTFNIITHQRFHWQ